MKQAYGQLSDRDLLGKLAQMSATSGKAAMAYAALTDDDWFSAISELRRRFRAREIEASLNVEETRLTPTGRLRIATTVDIDPQRWRAYWSRQRMTLVAVSLMIGRTSSWASIIANKKRAGIASLDELATAIEVNLEDLIFAVGSDRERERSGLLR